MFYWKQKSVSGISPEDELLNCQSVSKVYIASAFLSVYGIDILEKMKSAYSLGKKEITLYLSAQFSADKPHQLLDRLSDICVTKIVFDPTFHPKVYFLEGTPGKLIYGSSNLTTGGMERNIEFDYIGEPTLDEKQSLHSFFSSCDYHAREVDAEIIQYYRENQTKISDLYRSQKTLASILTGYMRKNDAFSKGEYDIEKHYFDFEDYETFFKRNRKNNDSDIRERRKKVQQKMLNIHELIYPEIKRLGIECHKNDKYITSQIIPNDFNYHSVGWLAVRYGKTPAEIDILKSIGYGDNDGYGFQKHGCLQFGIYSEGFDINLFLSVRNDAVDRGYLEGKMPEIRSDIETEIGKLQGYGMKWHIWDDKINKPYTFSFDKENPSDFYDFYRTYDDKGRESYLQTLYPPNDEVLLSKESIGREVLRVMKLLLPLYNTIVWRPGRGTPPV